jgi:hypothetical protein
MTDRKNFKTITRKRKEKLFTFDNLKNSITGIEAKVQEGVRKLVYPPLFLLQPDKFRTYDDLILYEFNGGSIDPMSIEDGFNVMNYRPVFIQNCGWERPPKELSDLYIWDKIWFDFEFYAEHYAEGYFIKSTGVERLL